MFVRLMFALTFGRLMLVLLPMLAGRLTLLPMFAGRLTALFPPPPGRSLKFG